QKMHAALEPSLLATELADYLVRKGLPFREAHHVVGRIVKEQGSQMQAEGALPLSTLQSYSPLFTEDAATAFDFRAAVERRTVLGGTAPASVRAQIAQAMGLLGDA
ncbi:MAG: argininosuccinate lyase, partial [Anaerolineales bacterium]|nr:argininosuccinate lyase [Anaerolineales bacterium]